MSTATQPNKSDTDSDRNGDQLPSSRRVYINGAQSGVRVPFREIDQNPTRNFAGSLEENPPVRVYDTSGPYGDPAVQCDVREGLPALRREWIVARTMCKSTKAVNCNRLMMAISLSMPPTRRD